MDAPNGWSGGQTPVDASVAQYSLLAKLVEADPSLTYDRRREVLEGLLSLDSGASPRPNTRRTISKLKGEHLL
jgi:hypothetical protein